MQNFLMFLPNMVVLLGRMLKDVRVPTAERLYSLQRSFTSFRRWISFRCISFIGQVDDIYVVALTLLRLISYRRRHCSRTLVGRRRYRLAC
jgi:hypothetical protein